RDEDGHLDAEDRARRGQTVAVIAGRRGHHPRSLGQRRERRERAPELERARELLGLELEERARTELRARLERRDLRVPADGRASELEVALLDAPARQAASAAR